MSSRADAIADAVLREFYELPKSGKPIVRDNGVHEWVPLSGIVAEDGAGSLRCVALATGSKCLPAAKLSEADGLVLHDWHAEVLAIRTLNHFILQECGKVARGLESEFLSLRTGAELDIGTDRQGVWPRFAWRQDVILHMYCSEAPCGDASMELIMAAQDDPSPWDVPQERLSPPETAAGTALPGRAFFSQLGVVRRKPGRGDAPKSFSKSCSDKLALKQCLSLLCAVASLLVSPEHVYLRTLVLPESQLSTAACDRAFSAQGRMQRVAGRSWPGDYAHVPFEVIGTAREFRSSKRTVAALATKVAPSVTAVVWSANGLNERLFNGLLAGSPMKREVRRASQVSRSRMCALAQHVVALSAGMGPPQSQGALNGRTYRDLKEGNALGFRRTVKSEVLSHALQGWEPNVGDNDFLMPAG